MPLFYCHKVVLNLALLNGVQHKLKRGFDCLCAHACPLATEVPSDSLCLPVACARCAHSTNWLATHCSAGPGNSCNCNSNIAFKRTRCTFSHFACNLFANYCVLLKRFFAYTQNALLNVCCIASNAATNSS